MGFDFQAAQKPVEQSIEDYLAANPIVNLPDGTYEMSKGGAQTGQIVVLNKRIVEIIEATS